MAERCLRNPNSPAAGQAYFIVDKERVNPFEFWYPLIRGLGIQPPKISVPYLLVYFISFISELFFLITGVEPHFTRYECNLMAITNTYSTKKAEQDFGYKPCDTDAIMQETIQFFQKKYSINDRKTLKNEKISIQRIFGEIKDNNHFNKTIIIISLLLLVFLLIWPFQ